MKNIQKYLVHGLTLALVLVSTAVVSEAQAVMNASCPVILGEKTQKKFYVDYQGERIYMCCRNCVRGFKKNPEKYLKNFREIQTAEGEI